MSKKAKNSARGNRYTLQQKAEILAYVDTFNSQKGRGGAAAASRKFNISQITIGHWVKKSGKESSSQTEQPPTISSDDFAKKLKQLTGLHEAIGKKEFELKTLRSDYAELKKSL